MFWLGEKGKKVVFSWVEKKGWVGEMLRVDFGMGKVRMGVG